MNEILNILASVGFNWHVALANFVNFLIILTVLGVFFFKKIGTAIDTRESVIKRGLEDAKEAEVLLASAKNKESEMKTQALHERDAIIALAKEKGESLVSELKQEAEDEISARKEALKKEEDSLSLRTEEEFMKKAPHLIAALYSKALIKEMNEEENNAFIARMKA
jgi:F-type H+-transporting ATPase subunit b